MSQSFLLLLHNHEIQLPLNNVETDAFLHLHLLARYGELNQPGRNFYTGSLLPLSSEVLMNGGLQNWVLDFDVVHFVTFVPKVDETTNK